MKIKVKQHKIDIKLDLSKANESTAEKVVDFLQKNSPKDSGKYADGWTYKMENGKAVIFNERHWQRIHLLEEGHLIKNKATKNTAKGNKRVRPQPHVRPAFKLAKDIHANEVKEKLKIITK